MANNTSFLSLSSVFSFFVCIVIIMDGTSITSAMYLRFVRWIVFLEIFDIMITNGSPSIIFMIPCETMANLLIFRRGCEVILINPAKLVCTCTGVSDIGLFPCHPDRKTLVDIACIVRLFFDSE